MSGSHKPWWMYRHLRPLWGLLLARYGLHHPFVAPIPFALVAGVLGFARGATLPGGGTVRGGPIAVAVGYAVGLYLVQLLVFLARIDAAKRRQDAGTGD
ncbi:MAG: hypothetical protein QOF30_1678 [Acidimicrobiaceae bacterium]|nr:hypothetical protein [Acidimicrobiaceae bacterium]